MKKLIVCLLSVLVLLSLFAGCGTDEPGEVTPGETGEEDADFESIEDPMERLKAMIEAAGWPDGSIEFVVLQRRWRRQRSDGPSRGQLRQCA